MDTAVVGVAVGALLLLCGFNAKDYAAGLVMVILGAPVLTGSFAFIAATLAA